MTTRPISELPAFIQGLMTDTRDVLFIIASNIKLRMAEEGKPSTSPVQWDSERQRRAFFATHGFGGGIPYKRKGTYERGWEVALIEHGAQLYNHTNAAGAIGGLPSGWQSKIHRNRWNYLLQVLSDELNKLPDLLRNKFSVRSSNG